MSQTKTTTADARTRGDGMEQEALINQDSVKKLSQSSMSSTSQNLSYQQASTTDASVSLPATIPKGKIFNLIPHLVSHHASSQKRINLNKREPKFVPFEPYKAAITPIFPIKNKIRPPKLNRNNLDLNVLVLQMSEMKTMELNDSTTNNLLGAKPEKPTDVERLEKEILELKKERDYFSNELKFQSQVNSELKKLLVAAVGEDIQTKVNVLTEDKLQLAKALLDTAHNLSSHTEQIEFLAGQSEVWRSKFLASSLMVEELARWKASLTQKNDKLFASNKCLLELISHLREMLLEILRNLKFLANLKSFNMPSSNVLDLTSELLNISQQLVLHSGMPGMPDENLNINLSNSMTPTEKLAVEALQTSTQPLMPMQEAFKAIFGKAFLSLPSSGNNTDETSTTETN